MWKHIANHKEIRFASEYDAMQSTITDLLSKADATVASELTLYEVVDLTKLSSFLQYPGDVSVENVATISNYVERLKREGVPENSEGLVRLRVD